MSGYIERKGDSEDSSMKKRCAMYNVLRERKAPQSILYKGYSA
jgi:hypothetical protein